MLDRKPLYTLHNAMSQSHMYDGSEPSATQRDDYLSSVTEIKRQSQPDDM